MPTCNGVSAAIIVDGKPLDEYQTQVNNGGQEISCWIGSQVGKEFSIAVHSIPHSETKLVVEMDGSPTNKMRLRPQQRYTIKYCPISETRERAFIFSRVQLVDDDELADSANLAGLGTIVLTFTAIRIIGRSYYGAMGGMTGIPGQRRISERGKKGIQACVALGQEQRRVPAQSMQCVPLGVVARLVFQYRPLEYLQAQGIAPIPPPPLPSQPRQELSVIQPGKCKGEDVKPQPGPSKASTRTYVKRENQADIIDISDEEDFEKLHALRSRIDRALAKKAPSSVRVKKEVKKEVKRESVSVFSNGEVIDLT